MIRAGFNTLRQHGLGGLWTRVQSYARYHWREKWEFHYLEFSLTDTLAAFPQKDPVEVRLATRSDIPALESDVFSRDPGPDAYDRRYFALIGRDDVRCYLALRDGTIVHYTWVFLDASTSPIREVPFNPALLRSGDVYVGPVYTDPSARGFLFLYVLGRVVDDLRRGGAAKRVLVLVAGGRAAAVGFYKKMGFKEILQPNRPDVFRSLRRLRRTG